MCGRFIQYSDPTIYASRYMAEVHCQAVPRYNVAPTQPVLLIRGRKGRDGRELVAMRWGLVPRWSKGPDNRYSMINARAETVAEKPAYRDAFRHRRCLIPTEGFYEWRPDPGGKGSGKQPWLIRREDGEPFTLAGLWETWTPTPGQGAASEAVESCSIIVTGANTLIAPIHDRMPVILDPADHAAWLDPRQGDLAVLHDMLRPAPAAGWTLYPVSRAVNSPRTDDPSLMEPLQDALP